MGACYVCNGILVDAGHLNSKYAFGASGIWTGFTCGFLIQKAYLGLILCWGTLENIQEHYCEEVCHLIMQCT